MFDTMIKMLSDAGYEAATPGTEPTELGTHEYLPGVAANKKMITIGPGYAGETGCFTVFYFTIDSGELIHHGSNCETDD